VLQAHTTLEVTLLHVHTTIKVDIATSHTPLEVNKIPCTTLEMDLVTCSYTYVIHSTECTFTELGMCFLGGPRACAFAIPGGTPLRFRAPALIVFRAPLFSRWYFRAPGFLPRLCVSICIYNKERKHESRNRTGRTV
jgi:hypothetical protein